MTMFRILFNRRRWNNFRNVVLLNNAVDIFNKSYSLQMPLKIHYIADSETSDVTYKPLITDESESKVNTELVPKKNATS